MKVHTILSAVGALVFLSAVAQSTFAQEKGNGQVKLLSKGVEIFELKSSAEQCTNSKGGTTVRLKVTSETPVDVGLYYKTLQKKWSLKVFADKKTGEEVTHFTCFAGAPFKVYSRASGSSEAWPQP